MSMNNMGLGLTLYAEDAASGPIGKVGKALGGLDKQADKSGASMKDVGGEMKKIGTVMAVAGAAGLAGLGYAVEMASEFAGKIREVATEADLSKFSQDEMARVAKDLAVTYGKMPTEQAEAMYSAVAFGANDAAKATDLLGAANKLAIAGVTDVKTATDALAGTVRAYNLDFSKAGDVSDVFFKAMTQGKMKVGDLAHAMPKATGIAASLGVSYAELAGSIALLTSRGTNADEAVTGIKAALVGIIKPSSDASAEAARLGIKFDQATLRAKGWPKFLSDIRNNSKYSAETMTKLFASVEGGNAVLQMVGGGMGDMDDMMKSMGDRAGATEGGFNIMSSSVDRLKAGFAVAMIEIGDALMPVKKIVVGAALAVVTAFNSIPKPIKNAIVIAVALGAAFLFIAGTVIAVVGSLVMAGAAVAASAEAILIALAAVTGIAEYAAVAILALGAAAYVAKLAFEQNLGGIGDFFREQAAKTRLAWDAIVQLFTSGEFSGAVMDELNKAGNEGVKDFAIQVFLWVSRVKNFLVSLADGFNATFSGLGPVFARLRDSLSALFALFGVAKDGPEQAGAAYASWGATGLWVGTTIANAVGWVVDAIATAIGWVAAFGAGFKNVAPDVDTATSSFSRLWGALAPIGAALSQIGVGMTGASGASNGFATLLGGMTGLLGQGINLAVNFISIGINTVASVLGGFIGIFSGVATIIQGIVGVIIGLLTGNWQGAWDSAKSIVFGAIQAIVSYLSIFVGIVAGILDGIAGMFGKDLGLSKQVTALKSAALGSLGDMLGKPTGPVATTAAANAIAATPGATPPGAAPPGTAPAGATPGEPGAPPGTAPPTPPPTGTPAVAAAATAPDVGAQVAAAIKAQPPATVNLNNQTTLTVDGQVLADIVDQHSTAGAARGNK